MTRQDYLELARIFGDRIARVYGTGPAEGMADELAARYPNFDRARFMREVERRARKAD